MKLNIKEIALFGMLGALMYASKMALEILPNVHLLAAFIMAETVVYRQKALYPIYTFVLITGLLNGFSIWWWPYLYLWTILWGAGMLLPKEMPKKVAPVVYMIVCSLHGFLYGSLYAPYQALMFHLDFKGMISWIIAGLPYDAIHGVSNFFCALLVVPLVTAMSQAQKYVKD
jgi:energy-coupling factor transport system substrate-specific component